MTTTVPVPGKVTWFEVGSCDTARAAAFYSGLFGWQPQGDPAVYLAIAPAADGGVAGGIIPVPPEVEPYALFGVEVTDVDLAYATALDLGATSVIEPTDNPGGVRSAYLRDPDGSMFAVHRFGRPPTT